jgi:pimeloyl-ACP methyl ester carboxylesterase
VSSPAGHPRRRQVTLRGAQVQVVEAGDPQAPPFLFLHGWPESSAAWARIMSCAVGQAHALAVDLPGVGTSAGLATDGSKSAVAAVVHDLIGTLGLTDVTLVGHDIGGMVTYRYLRDYRDISRAVIMNVPVPGVEPWDDFVRLPALFHFALHSIPELPEALIQGRQREYFDYFYSALSADPSRITAEARGSYAAAYAADDQLTAGFDWYRAFPRDIEDNRRASLGPRGPRSALVQRSFRGSGSPAPGRRGPGSGSSSSASCTLSQVRLSRELFGPSSDSREPSLPTAAISGLASSGGDLHATMA